MGTAREQRRATWRELVSEQARSGHGVTAFCRERGIRTASFYDWKKRLGVDDEIKARVPRDRSSSLEQKTTGEPPVRFLELKLAAAAEPIQSSLTHCSIIEVRLPHGRSLMVAPDFDAMHLQRLLAVLDSAVLVDKSLPAGWQAAS